MWWFLSHFGFWLEELGFRKRYIAYVPHSNTTSEAFFWHEKSGMKFARASAICSKVKTS